MGILKGKTHIAFPAKDMDNPSGILQRIEFLPGINKNNTVGFRITHYLTIRICLPAKIPKNHEK